MHVLSRQLALNDLAQILITLGGLFLVGLIADGIGRRSFLPRVTLLLLVGAAVGPSGLALLPELTDVWFTVVSHLALAMVGFLLGGALTRARLREHGRAVMWISVTVVVATGAVMALGLWGLGFPVALALLLGGIAPATDPAATADVIHELRADGRFARTLLGIVAVDDAWGLIGFGLTLAAAQALTGDGAPAAAIGTAAWELGGAIALGVVLGVPMAYLTGRVAPGEPTLAEALGGVFLCSGIALWLEVSFLLAAVALGAVVANLARHHTRPFAAIENVEWPFMILFFVLAGASLDLGALGQLAGLTAGYVVLRAGGRLAGGWIGAVLSGADGSLRRWVGPALMPQAGVALGMALVASVRVPELGAVLLPVVIASTVLFEVVGPVVTRVALLRAGEDGRGGSG